MDDDPVDLSAVGLSADPASRAALVGRVMAHYLAHGRRRVTLWSAIVAYRRPMLGLMAASLVVAAVLIRGAAPHPLMPQSMERWIAGPSTPSPLEVMFAMAETP